LLNLLHPLNAFFPRLSKLLSISSDCNSLQSLKDFSPILLTVVGIFKLSILQLLNAPKPICSNPLFNVILVRFIQLPNVKSSIFFIFDGNISSCIDELLNAPYSIISIESFNFILIKLVQFLNAPSDITLTFLGISIDVIPESQNAYLPICSNSSFK